MAAATWLRPRDVPALPEQPMLISGVSWKDYVILREALDTPGLRMILDKLHVYDGFQVPEVWLWKDGAFELYGRRAAGGYGRIERSALLPKVDFALMARFVTREDQDVALQEFAEAVRKTEA